MRRDLLPAGYAEELESLHDELPAMGIDIVRADGSPYPWQEETGARICLAARRHGLLTRPIRDTLVLMPPLCFDSGQLADAVGALRTAIREVCGEN